MTNTKRTIIHIAPYYPPHMGGLQQVAKKSAEGMSARGYNIKVVTTTSSGNNKGVFKNAGIEIIVLKSFEFAHTPVALGFFWYLLKIPKKSLIHLHLSQAFYPEIVLFICKLRGIPYITHFHLDVGPSGNFGKLFLIYKKIIWGPLLRNAKTVIACSADQVPILTKKYRVSKDRITVILNAVDDSFFVDKHQKFLVDKFKILYIGRIAWQKRIERIIRAVKILTIPILFTIVGDGDERSKLESMVKELGLTNIEFVGRKNNEQMQQYHKENDALVISSDEEGSSLVVLEAMAGGMPILGTNVIGIKELLLDTGIVVDKPYSENFAKVIENLWKKPYELERLSIKSIEKARTYRWSRFLDQLQIVYEKNL